MSENILSIAGKDIRLTWAASTRGGEYCGACPLCGGKDRFRVWPAEGETGHFWCRKCEKRGDVIDYLRLTKKLSFKDASAQVGVVRAPAGLKWRTPSWRHKALHTPPPMPRVQAITHPEEYSLPPDTPCVISTANGPLDDDTPAAVIRYDCWGGCIHYKHWQDSYVCHQLTGDRDLTASGVKCPVQEIPDNRLRLPVLSASGISPEDCQGCHWLGGTLDSRVCISVDVKLKSLGDCPGFESDRVDWILTTGLEPLPAV